MMENKEGNSRRSFLRTAAAGAALAAVSPAALAKDPEMAPVIVPASAKGANDRIRVAVLGINGRGESHIEEIMGLSEKANVEVAVLCDPDMDILQVRASEFETEIWQKSAD